MGANQNKDNIKPPSPENSSNTSQVRKNRYNIKIIDSNFRKNDNNSQSLESFNTDQLNQINQNIDKDFKFSTLDGNKEKNQKNGRGINEIENLGVPQPIIDINKIRTIEENNIINNQSIQQENQNDIENPDEPIEKSYYLIYILTKNFQAHRISFKTLEKEIDGLFSQYKEDDSISEEDVVNEFEKMIKGLITVNDVNQGDIVSLIRKLLTFSDYDIATLKEKAKELFANVDDYRNIFGEENLLEHIHKKMNENEKFIKALEEFKNRNNVGVSGRILFSFDDFNGIAKETGFYLEDEVIEYILFRLKLAELPINNSIFNISFEELMNMAEGKAKPINENK